MRAIINTAFETFLLLQRDRIFLPVVLVGFGLLFLSGLASYWGIEEFRKILYDFGSFIFHIMGISVAIFWGTKLLSDSKLEGAIELQLASPITRYQWLIGKFLGLSFALIFISVLMLAGWQLIYVFWGMGLISGKSLSIFGLLTLSWLVMAAVAILFSSVSSQAVSLFASFWLLICGLLSQPVYQALSPETPQFIREIASFTAGIWNLHTFDTSSYAVQKGYITAQQATDILTYGMLLIVTLISIACISFQRRDLKV